MRKVALGAAALLVAASLVSPPTASAIDRVDSTRLRKAVSVEGILVHERALQKIADKNGGTRASGTPGYSASGAYVIKTMKKAGYRVTKQTFDYNYFQELAAPTLSVGGKTYETQTFSYSGSGQVSGQVVPVSNNVIPPAPTPSSTAGCLAEDFPAAPAGPSIALIQRGGCDFAVKVDNAVTAGYDAVIIFNEGQPGRDGPIGGTLGNSKPVPVVDLSFADGAEIYAATQAGTVNGEVSTSTKNEVRSTFNIIADSPKGKKSDEVVVVGAHLDSVNAGPGINDNGSGTATVLEIAKQMSALGFNARLQRKMRYAFWGAEEANLVGSTYYVNNLDDTRRSHIYANLNFDMLGSPNYARLVYDGDGSDTGTAGPDGSGAIERLFLNYFKARGLASQPTAFDGRSDYGPFIDVGIPAGGLFSGAEEIKTPAQVQLFHGTAGVAFDKCYHQACDTIDNLNPKALNELGDAAAHVTLVLALSKSGLYPDGSRMAAKSTAKRTGSVTEQQGHAVIR